jgi:hypothetical protein
MLNVIEIPKDFYTLPSMLTLSGSVGAVFIICNGIQAAFNYNPKWLALMVAVLIALAGVYFSHGTGSDYFVGFVNGFLIYGTASGATQVLGKPTAQQGTARTVAANVGTPQKRTFLSSWW